MGICRRSKATRRLTALSVLGGLKRELGDLDRVSAWLMVYGLVNAAPDFVGTTNMINGFSDLVLDLYRPEAGAPLAFGLPVSTEAESQP